MGLAYDVCATRLTRSVSSYADFVVTFEGPDRGETLPRPVKVAP